MAKDGEPSAAKAVNADAVEAGVKPAAATPRREIPGNLPYLTASGTLKKVLDKIIEAQRPDRFNQDFLENVLKLTGGGARATIPILKRMGFLSSDGAPTELYAKFKTDSGRGYAALNGLKNGFAEIFKRSEYAHHADDNKIRDLIVEITGLKSNDPVAGAIRSTFNVVKGYIPSNFDSAIEKDVSPAPAREDAPLPEKHSQSSEHDTGSLRLAYNINIVLPETSDLAVLNAIFKSIKENLLR